MSFGVSSDYYPPLDDPTQTDQNAGDYGGGPDYGYAYAGGLGDGGTPGPAALAEPTADIAFDAGPRSRAYQPWDTTPIGVVQPDMSLQAPNGQPTGNRINDAEGAAFGARFPGGGSFDNPFGGLQQAWNTANPDPLNPISHPSAGNVNRIPTIEEQAFGGNPVRVETPALRGLEAAGGGAPTAMAAGQGWFVDAQGRFHSDNDGINIRANAPGAGEAFSVGPGTILDTGAPRGPIGAPNALSPTLGPGLTYAQDQITARRPIGDIGLTMLPEPALTGLTQPGGTAPLGGGGGLPGRAAAAPGGPLSYLNPAGDPTQGASPYQNFITRRGDTLSETYGGGATARPGGPVGGGVLPDAQRVVRDASGRVYVTDPNGYMAPMQDAKGNNWSSIEELRANVFDLGAQEKLRVLARLGDASAKTVLAGLGPDVLNSQSAQQATLAHNAEVGRTGMGTRNEPLANPVADTGAFPVEYALIDQMKKDGMNVSNSLVNGNIAYQDTNGQTRYIPGWQAGQMLQARGANK